jgi:hypothetical protein
MKIKIELDEGGSLVFDTKNAKPFDYTALLPNADGTNKIYDIEFISESVDISTNKIQLKAPGKVSAKGAFFNNPLTIFALVEGGCLPPPWVEPSKLLVDRNVLSSLQQVVHGSGRKDQQSTAWWVQFLQDEKVLINPFLYALEEEHRPPSFNEFCRAFEEASADAVTIFPRASVVKYDLYQYEIAYNLIIRPLYEKTRQEIDFFLKTVPFILNRAGDPKLSSIEHQILEIARSLRLDLCSLPVLAVLSCLYENRNGSGFLTGRRLIKPRIQYTEEDAYNTLSDIKALELFLNIRATIQEPYALCTCDLAIALFWCGLEVRDVHYIPITESIGYSEFSFSITENLFPRLEESDRSLLKERLLK